MKRQGAVFGMYMNRHNAAFSHGFQPFRLPCPFSGIFAVGTDKFRYGKLFPGVVPSDTGVLFKKQGQLIRLLSQNGCPVLFQANLGKFIWT